MSDAARQPIRYCAVCGAPSAAGSTFCVQCGRALEVPSSAGVVYCRECGGETSLGDAFCPRCGAAQPARARTTTRERPTSAASAPEPPPHAPLAPAPAAPPSPRPSGAGPVVVVTRREPSLGASIAWYFFVGIWLSHLVNMLAWMAAVTVVGMPVGIWLAKRVPEVLTLRSVESFPQLSAGRDRRIVSVERAEQLPFATRAVYFVTVGWWFSLVWLVMAWLLALMILPIPVAEWMYEHLATVTTLEMD